MRKIKKSALLWIIENSRFVTIPLTVLVALSMLSSFCQDLTERPSSRQIFLTYATIRFASSNPIAL